MHSTVMLAYSAVARILDVCVSLAGQHMEEMVYLSGQLNVLKDKLALADRDMAVTHAIKVRQRNAKQQQ